MKRVILIVTVVLGMAFTISCGGAAPLTATVTKTAPAAPAATVTKTAPAAPAATVTVTQTAPAATVTVTPTLRLTKVRDAEAIGGSGVFYGTVGKNQGFFEKRGIDLEVVQMSVALTNMALFVGQAEVGPRSPLAYFPERKDARVIGPHTTFTHSVIVRKDSPYRSYQDLKGKKIALFKLGGAQYDAVKVLTMLEGLNLEKDFQLVPGEAAVEIAWLLKGEVEAIHLAEPFTSKLLVSDGDKVKVLHELNALFNRHTGNNLLVGGIVTSDAWAKANPELARQVGLAYQDVLLYLYGHQDVWKSDLAKKTFQIEDPAVLELLVKRIASSAEVPPYSPRYKAALVKQAQLMVEAGALSPEAVDWLKGAILFAD